MDQGGRTFSINRLLDSKKSNNRFSAYNIFAKAYRTGEVKKPANPERELEDYFNAYQKETDGAMGVA
jgi:hypothetical protein